MFDIENEEHLRCLSIKNYKEIKKLPSSSLYDDHELVLMISVLTYISVVERKNIKYLFYEELRKEFESSRFFSCNSRNSRTVLISGDRESEHCMRMKDERNFVNEIINTNYINEVERVIKISTRTRKVRKVFLSCCFNGGVSEEIVKEFGYSCIQSLGSIYRIVMGKVRNELGIKVKGCRKIESGNMNKFKASQNESERRWYRKRKDANG